MKKVYVAPQSEIVKLIGKEHTMQMDLGLGTQTGSGGTTFNAFVFGLMPSGIPMSCF